MGFPSTGLTANALSASKKPEGREIDRTLKTLFTQLEQLAASIAELDSRLAPVCSPVPCPGPAEFPDTTVPLSDQLLQLCRRVDEMQRQVTCLLHGLAI